MRQSNIRACLITNPKSGRGHVDLSEAITVLQSHGWDVAVRQKRHGGGATELAREAARQGYTVVVDCGGDGTLNEILEGVAGTTVAVGTIPGGTANLWAHEMGISRRPAVAALQLVGSEQRRVDVGWVAVNGHHKRHFLLCAGLGFDGAVLEHLSKPLKNRIGWLAYTPAMMGAMRAFRGAPVDAEMDEMHWHGRVPQIVIANTRRYGGFTRISPWAYIDDGLLDVCLLTPNSMLSLSRQMGSLLLRQRPNLATAQIYRAATISIRSPFIMPLQVDGGSIHIHDEDLTDEGVVYTFSLKAQGLSVLVPRSYSGGLFQPRLLAESLAEIPLYPVVVPAIEGAGQLALGNGHHDHGGKNGKNGKNGHHRHGEKHGAIQDVHAAHNGSRNGYRAEAGDGLKTWKMRVLAIGADSLTTVRVKDGRIVHVDIGPDTVLADESGSTQPLWGTLSWLTEGDLVRVSGAKGAQRGIFLAQRVLLCSRSLTHKQQKQAQRR